MKTSSVSCMSRMNSQAASAVIAAASALAANMLAPSASCQDTAAINRGWQVPPGFEVRAFAREPMVIDPLAMTWDEQGRLWVLESSPDSPDSGMQIKVLDDENGDGSADKSHKFTGGL